MDILYNLGSHESSKWSYQVDHWIDKLVLREEVFNKGISVVIVDIQITVEVMRMGSSRERE